MSAPKQNTRFKSDNTAGMCPEAFEAYSKANEGSMPSYGKDSWTERAAKMLRDLFESDCDVFFVFNGTAANALAAASCCQGHHSIISYDHAHIYEDECGAPEFFSGGAKLLGATGTHGKITPAEIEELAVKASADFPKARMVSVTESTELGTVYQLAELAAIREVSRRHKLFTHMDGARFSNAVASLGVAPKEIIRAAGVDVLCFGGTKNGMAASEAMIFFNRNLAEDFEYRCKRAGQLASKGRFLAAGWVGMLENGAWLKYARQANQFAQLLARRLQAEAGFSAAHPVQANGVFVILPAELVKGLKERGWVFSRFNGGVSRFMCSWQTSEADIDALISDFRILNKT